MTMITSSIRNVDMPVFSIGCDAHNPSHYIGAPGIKVKQELYISISDLEKANNLIRNYNPDMDCITTINFTIPYQWEKDFGGGWSVTLDVIQPSRNGKEMDAYCEAVLYRHGEIVHRSVRDNKLDGIWGLRYNDILFQVEVKAV